MYMPIAKGWNNAPIIAARQHFIMSGIIVGSRTGRKSAEDTKDDLRW